MHMQSIADQFRDAVSKPLTPVGIASPGSIPQHPPTVSTALGDLTSAINRLEDVHGVLRSRLEGVLAPSPVDPSDAAEKMPVFSGSPVCVRIQELTRVLNTHISELMLTANQLDIDV